MASKTLKELLDELIHAEGGYVDNVHDKGGKTMYGVTETVARQNGYKGAMQVLPRSLAEAIYTKQYWTTPGFDRVAVLAPSIAAELFDCGVNMGPSTGVKFLQRVLNAYNRQQKLYDDIAVDGQIGPGLLSALKECLSDRGSLAESVLLKGIVCLRGERYIELAEGRQANEEFVYGWVANRLNLTK